MKNRKKKPFQVGFFIFRFLGFFVFFVLKGSGSLIPPPLTILITFTWEGGLGDVIRGKNAFIYLDLGVQIYGWEPGRDHGPAGHLPAGQSQGGHGGHQVSTVAAFQHIRSSVQCT